MQRSTGSSTDSGLREERGVTSKGGRVFALKRGVLPLLQILLPYLQNHVSSVLLAASCWKHEGILERMRYDFRGRLRESLCGRDRGGGRSSPSLRAASPNGDTPTVHCTGNSRTRKGSQLVPEGHGFPFGIATHCPRPPGRGRSAEGAGGVGVYR